MVYWKELIRNIIEGVGFTIGVLIVLGFLVLIIIGACQGRRDSNG